MGHCVLGALAPRSRFQFGSGAPRVQQSISGCVWPLAVYHRQTERRCPSPGAVACPRRLLLLRGRCALPAPAARPESSGRGVLPSSASPLALSLAAVYLAASSLLLFAKCPGSPSRFKVPGGKWGVGEERISGRQIWSLRIAAAAAARRPPEAPARCARRPKLDGGGPRLGHRRLRPRLPLHPKDQEPLLGLTMLKLRSRGASGCSCWR